MTPIELAEVTGAKLVDAPLLSIRGGIPITMRIMTQNKVVILNTTALPVTWNAGTLLCAYGKGAYNAKPDKTAVDHNTEVLFTLKDDTSLVVYNNSLTTLGQRGRSGHESKCCRHVFGFSGCLPSAQN